MKDTKIHSKRIIIKMNIITDSIRYNDSECLLLNMIEINLFLLFHEN